MNWISWIKYIIYFVVIVGLLVSGALINRCSNKPDWKQSNSNQISEIKPREVLYTVKDFEQYKHTADSIAKANNIPKTKYLTKYIRITDTLIISDTIRPEKDYILTEECRVINYANPCLNLEVVSMLDTNIVTAKINYDIFVFDYWKYSYSPFVKRLWKFDFSKINEIKVVNACSGDTVKVIDNIKIIKRK